MSFSSQMEMLRMHRAVKNGKSSRVAPQRYRAADDPTDDLTDDELKDEYKREKKDSEEDKDVEETDKVSRARARFAKYQTEWQNAMQKAKADGAGTPGKCERLVEARHPQLRGKLMLAGEALQEALRR